jgi:hypothetical protein
MAVERRPVGYLPAFGFFGYHAEFHEVVIRLYQSQMHVASVKPYTVRHGRGKEW